MAIYSINNLDQLASILGIAKTGDDQDYRKAIMEGINLQGEKFWNKLPRNVQQWYNLNVDNFHAGHGFIDLPELSKKSPKLGTSSKSNSIQIVLIDSLLKNPFLTNKELWNECIDQRVLVSLNTVSHYASTIRGILRILEDRSLLRLPDEPPLE